MEPLFSIEYSEYCVEDTLSKLLYTRKQFNVTVFVPTSRQEKGIDLMLYRHEDATCHNFTATIQVKSSRVYSLSEEEIQKSNNCSFALWYPKFSPSPRADFFVLTAQYPHFPKTPYLTQGKRGSSSASVHWKNLFLLFTHAEMVEFLNHAKTKKDMPESYFGILFNSPTEIYTGRGFYNSSYELSFHDLSKYSLTSKNKLAIKKLRNSLSSNNEVFL